MNTGARQATQPTDGAKDRVIEPVVFYHLTALRATVEPSNIVKNTCAVSGHEFGRKPPFLSVLSGKDNRQTGKQMTPSRSDGMVGAPRATTQATPSGRAETMTKGLLIVFTGNGKGKTTAALGMAMRAAGHGLRVCVIQFIKGSWHYGELDAVRRFDGLIDLHVMGKGFTWKSENIDEDARLAREAWTFAQEAIASGRYHTVVLDEFTYLLHYRMLELAPCLAFLASRNPAQHVVITGRYAQPELIEAADLVTEMQAIKHPLTSGIKAQQGIEF
jgi:cob(I)alamin adenosyltransferase